MKTLISFFALTVLLSSSSGCQVMQKVFETKDNGGAGIKNVVNSADLPDELKDVPIPNGFRYQADKSFRNHTNYEASRLYYVKSSTMTRW